MALCPTDTIQNTKIFSCSDVAAAKTILLDSWPDRSRCCVISKSSDCLRINNHRTVIFLVCFSVMSCIAQQRGRCCVCLLRLAANLAFSADSVVTCGFTRRFPGNFAALTNKWELCCRLWRTHCHFRESLELKWRTETCRKTQHFFWQLADKILPLLQMIQLCLWNSVISYQKIHRWINCCIPTKVSTMKSEM